MANEWRLAPSRYARLLFAASFFAVLAALSQLDPERYWQGLVLLGATLFYLCDWADLFRPAMTAMDYRQGQWMLALPGGWQPVSLEQSHFLFQQLGVLRFRTVDGQRRSVVLLPDSLSGEQFRRLAIVLRRGSSVVPG